MLTRKQNELLNYIELVIATEGTSPSFEEMKEALGLKSKSGVHRLVSALEERGYIRRLTNRARALEVVAGRRDETAGKRPILRAEPVNPLAGFSLHQLQAEIERRVGMAVAA